MKPPEEAFYREFGEQVRVARLDAGLLQEELGHYLHLTRSSIANIETGRQGVSVYIAMQIHGLLGISIRGIEPNPDRQVSRLERDRLAAKLEEAQAKLAAIRKVIL